ncbi:hypothetical protein FQA39_LY10402 [Lamprigera yunnana]|nr:hypothetical protein FQA39_LY10402 [Lamprigera yunnana]
MDLNAFFEDAVSLFGQCIGKARCMLAEFFRKNICRAEYVRKNDELNDLSHRRYSDNQYKTNVWVTIGEKLQLDGQECKHRWKAIRGQYKRFLSFKKTRTGQAADPKARWKYGDILEFLRPFMKNKERSTSVTTENSSVSTINDEDTKYDPQLTEDLDASEDPQVSQDSEASYTPNASQILIISEDETLLRDSQSNLQVTVPQNKKEKTPKRAKSNVKVSTQAHTVSGTLMEYLLEEEKTKKAEVKDELDFFFESIKATVKKCSPADKHLVKSKISGIVSDIEAKYIHQQQHIQYSVYQVSNSQVPLTIESPSKSTFHSSNHSSSSSIPSRPCSNFSASQSYHSSPTVSYFENCSVPNNFAP